jgi:hypothetical protein
VREAQGGSGQRCQPDGRGLRALRRGVAHPVRERWPERSNVRHLLARCASPNAPRHLLKWLSLLRSLRCEGSLRLVKPQHSASPEAERRGLRLQYWRHRRETLN